MKLDEFTASYLAFLACLASIILDQSRSNEEKEELKKHFWRAWIPLDLTGKSVWQYKMFRESVEEEMGATLSKYESKDPIPSKNLATALKILRTFKRGKVEMRDLLETTFRAEQEGLFFYL